MKNMQNAQTANMILGGASIMLNMIFGGFASTNSVSYKDVVLKQLPPDKQIEFKIHNIIEQKL